MNDKVEAVEEMDDEVGFEEQYRSELIMGEFLKMFAMGCVTGKSRKDTLKYNQDNMVDYINGLEYITASLNSGDFPEFIIIKNKAMMVCIAKFISDGFNPDRYPDIIREYIDIRELDEYDLDRPTESISIMLADIVMGNRTLVSKEVSNAYGIYASMFVSLYENYKKAKNIDIVLDSQKIVV